MRRLGRGRRQLRTGWIPDTLSSAGLLAGDAIWGTLYYSQQQLPRQAQMDFGPITISFMYFGLAVVVVTLVVYGLVHINTRGNS